MLSLHSFFIVVINIFIYFSVVVVCFFAGECLDRRPLGRVGLIRLVGCSLGGFLFCLLLLLLLTKLYFVGVGWCVKVLALQFNE